MFCGPADTGRWVHAAPLLGKLDAAAEVEAVAECRLVYVIAFGNGGAKDVTQRYNWAVLLWGRFCPGQSCQNAEHLNVKCALNTHALGSLLGRSKWRCLPPD